MTKKLTYIYLIVTILTYIARRPFATTIILSKRVPMENVSRMLRHSTIRNTLYL